MCLFHKWEIILEEECEIKGFLWGQPQTWQAIARIKKCKKCNKETGEVETINGSIRSVSVSFIRK